MYLFWDNKYIDIRANRCPKLDEFVDDADEAYCVIDFWSNMNIRRVLMSSYNFFCTEFKPQDCMYCECRDVCDKWEEYIEDHKLDEEINFS